VTRLAGVSVGITEQDFPLIYWHVFDTVGSPHVHAENHFPREQTRGLIMVCSDGVLVPAHFTCKVVGFSCAMVLEGRCTGCTATALDEYFRNSLTSPPQGEILATYSKKLSQNSSNGVDRHSDKSRNPAFSRSSGPRLAPG
jgi:hypothetical protein